MVLVNLEGLWSETEPQNVPGTSSDERPNWQRKLPHDIEGVFCFARGRRQPADD